MALESRPVNLVRDRPQMSGAFGEVELEEFGQRQVAPPSIPLLGRVLALADAAEQDRRLSPGLLAYSRPMCTEHQPPRAPVAFPLQVGPRARWVDVDAEASQLVVPDEEVPLARLGLQDPTGKPCHFALDSQPFERRKPRGPIQGNFLHGI